MRGEQLEISHKPVILSNGFFDTTAANAATAGFELQTLTQPGLSDPFPQGLIGKYNYFKRNINVTITKQFLSEHQKQVAMVLMTITNNWAAAQSVSMVNIQSAALLAK